MVNRRAQEAKDYPFYGVQWHPEKNVWELGMSPDGMPYEAIPHTVEAIDTTLYMAKQLLLEARKNDHAFPDQATESAALIWVSFH